MAFCQDYYDFYGKSLLMEGVLRVTVPYFDTRTELGIKIDPLKELAKFWSKSRFSVQNGVKITIIIYIILLYAPLVPRPDARSELPTEWVLRVSPSYFSPRLEIHIN